MYKLRFYSTTNTEVTHYPTGKPLEKTMKGKGNRVTFVALYVGEKFIPEHVLATATVKRYFKDFDIPALGKKCAIEKLIETGIFSREERKEIWKTFWNHSSKVESLRHGAYKKEIAQVKQADKWRKWDEAVEKIEKDEGLK